MGRCESWTADRPDHVRPKRHSFWFRSGNRVFGFTDLLRSGYAEHWQSFVSRCCGISAMDGPDDENPPLEWPKNDPPAALEEGLFVSDVELCRRLGVGPRTGRIAVRSLQHNGFPPKDPVFGNKRNSVSGSGKRNNLPGDCSSRTGAKDREFYSAHP